MVSPHRMIRHLYVHIPFCARICPYCAFYKDLPGDRVVTASFCSAIVAELARAVNQFTIIPETIFFGGGTPTALGIDQLQSLLTGFRNLVDFSHVREFTVEANPGSVSRRKAAALRDGGVTRMSLGVQSWDDGLLTLLGREHGAAQAEQTFRTLRKVGFGSINIDLMFGLPGQTEAQWRATLDKTVSLGPDHISAYCLTFEEDTDFFLRHRRGEFVSDTDHEADLFAIAAATLADAGYEHYEISNYARRNHRSMHNQAYWAGEDYLGLGPSAFSTIGGERWQNVCDYRRYSELVLSSQSPIASVENLTAEMKHSERVALGLRTADGVPVAALAGWPGEVSQFTSLGLLARRNGSYVLTPAGKCLADEIAAAFV